METEILDRLNRGRSTDGVSEVTTLIIARLDQLHDTQKSLSNELHELRNLMERLVVLEERYNSHNKALERFGLRMDRFGEKLHEVEKCVDSRAFAYRWIERALMVGTGAAVVKFISMFKI